MPKSLIDTLTEPAPFSTAQERENNRLRLANSELKQRCAAYLRELDRAEHEKAVLLALDDRQRRKAWDKPAKVTKGEACAVHLWSDWHIEETITEEEVNGVNRWTLRDAERAVQQISIRSVEVVNRYRAMAKISEAVIGLLGDFITGYLRPEHIAHNSLSPIRACQKAEDLIGAAIEYQLTHGGYERLTVATVTGNHGRTTEKLWASGRNDTSYETLIYEHLRKQLKTPRINWCVGGGQFNFVNVFQWRSRFVHGDCFNYGGGVGGMSIPVNKQVDRWDANRLTRADMTFFGHLHNFLWNAPNRWICNGALPGSGAYSLKYGYSEPCQTVAIVDRKRGLTDAAKVFAR